MKNLLKKTIVVAMALMMAAVFMPFVPGVNYVANAGEGGHTYSAVSGSNVIVCDNHPSKSLTLTAADSTYGNEYTGIRVDLTQDWDSEDYTSADADSKNGVKIYKKGTTTAITDTSKLPAGDYVAKLTLGGAVAVKEFKVAPKELTVNNTKVNKKAYDGTKSATAELGTGSILNGVVGNDDVKVLIKKAEFADAAVGSQTANVTYSLTGKAASNYTVKDSELSADITQKDVTVSVPSSITKEYDGSTDITIPLTVSGKVGKEDVKCELQGQFKDEKVGTSKVITVSDSTLTLSGADSGNYHLKTVSVTTTGLKGSITKKAVTVTFKEVVKDPAEDLLETFDYTAKNKDGGSVDLTGVKGKLIEKLTNKNGKYPPGVYTISIANKDAVVNANSNYKLTFVDGNYIITDGTRITPTLEFEYPTMSKNCGDADFRNKLTAKNSEDKALSGVKYKYTSSNKNVATVNEESGLVHIVGQGETTITVTVKADEKYETATANYVLSVDGSFTTSVPQGQTLVYNGSEQTGFTLPADAKYTVVEASSTLKATKVGEYKVVLHIADTVSNEWKLANGTTSIADQTITWKITPKPIKVKANNQSSLVGEALKTLTYTSDALCGSDKLTGALATTANKDKAGTYDITQGTLAAGSNYTITFTKGTYTVKKPEGKTKFMAKVKAYKSKLAFSWTSVSGAKYYKVFYKNMNKSSYASHKVSSGTSWTWSSTKYIKKDNVYKARVKAYDANGNVLKTSPYIYVTPTYGKKTNVSKVKVSTSSLTVSLANDEGEEVTATRSKVSSSKKLLTVKNVRSVRYLSADTNVVETDENVIYAVAKGVAKVYAVAPNGVYAVIDVEVI